MSMPKFRKKYIPKGKKGKSLTGEDIDMLRERKEEGGLRSSSPSYKDHIDGA